MINDFKCVISVVVPCYNQAEYLEEALQSVFNQTFTDWECLIVNDGSSDDTEIIAKQWQEKDARFKYVYKENGGLSSARNFGIKSALGEFILPLDADDKIGQHYLEFSWQAFQKNDALKIVYCNAEKFGVETGNWELETYAFNLLLLKNMIFCSALFRKSDWSSINGYDENMKDGFEDWEFWIALLKNGGDVLQLDYIGFYYRIKNDSMIKELFIADEKKRNTIAYICIKHADIYVKWLGNPIEIYRENVYLKKKHGQLTESVPYKIYKLIKKIFVGK